MQQAQIKEAVGVFDQLENLDAAVAELEVTAFPRHDISVLATGNKVAEKYGVDVVRPEWLEDNPDAPRGISVRPEEKTIGASALIGCPAYILGCAAAVIAKDASHIELLAYITAGSLIGVAIGTALVFVIGNKMKSRIVRQIRKGGLLLWVRTPDFQREQIAQDIMRRHGGKHVHIHSIT